VRERGSSVDEVKMNGREDRKEDEIRREEKKERKKERKKRNELSTICKLY
jgi:hypothetical protein